MALLDKVVNEFEELTRTSFWKEYRVQLVEHTKTKINDLKTNSDKDKLPSIQAYIRALEWVEGLPERVFKSVKDKG